MKYLLLLSFLLIQACTNVQKQQLEKNAPIIKTLAPPIMLDSSVFGVPIEIIKPNQIIELTQQQKQEFLEEFNAPVNNLIAPYKRVYNFLEKRLDNYNYYSKTFTASKSLSLNQGNCLSLAILTKALADLAGVKISYQLVETEPVYQKENNIIISSQHIRSVLYDEISSIFTIIPAKITVDYFPIDDTRTLRNVEEAEFFSMYYRNLAAENIIQNDNNSAYWFLKQSLKLKNNDSEALNMIAILHDDAGYSDYAEKIYLYGLEDSTDKLNLLNNYHSLLMRLGKITEAEKIKRELDKYNESNPFEWISAANKSYNNGDYSTAFSLYLKASELAPYLHEPFAGMARSEYQLGDLDKAQGFLEKALTNSYNNKTRNLYQAKFDMLSQLLNKNEKVISKKEIESVNY